MMFIEHPGVSPKNKLWPECEKTHNRYIRKPVYQIPFYIPEATLHEHIGIPVRESTSDPAGFHKLTHADQERVRKPPTEVIQLDEIP